MRAFCLPPPTLYTVFHSSFAQLSFGVRGLNYDSFGDFTPTDVSLPNPQVDASTGFHLGVFTNIDLQHFTFAPNYNTVKVKAVLGGSLT